VRVANAIERRPTRAGLGSPILLLLAFLQQPSGASAPSVRGVGFGGRAAVFLGERPLATTYGNPGWLTAIVPDELYRKAGRLQLKVVNPDHRESNVIVFEVFP
jgi:hypothetical protein